MPSLLTSHLDQISLCATSISDLPFPAPKIFTNALLDPNHDITALIRDTEQHERALFHLAPPPLPKPPDSGAVDFAAPSAATARSGGVGGGRRATTYAGARQPKNKAVAAVLGGDLFQATRGTATKGEMDVEVLLRGAEKLAGV